MRYKYHRHNQKIIALIIEVILFALAIITILILEGVGVKVSIWPKIIVTGIFLFAFILTLSLIRYDAMRDIRTNFKETNLPLYTDQTTLTGQDIIDETKNKKSD